MLLKRHGREAGEHRIVEGTRRNCEAGGVPERFDEALTRKWVEVVAAALEEGDAETFDRFLEQHPELGRSDSIPRG